MHHPRATPKDSTSTRNPVDQEVRRRCRLHQEEAGRQARLRVTPATVTGSGFTEPPQSPPTALQCPARSIPTPDPPSSCPACRRAGLRHGGRQPGRAGQCGLHHTGTTTDSNTTASPALVTADHYTPHSPAIQFSSLSAHKRRSQILPTTPCRIFHCGMASARELESSLTEFPPPPDPSICDLSRRERCQRKWPKYFPQAIESAVHRR